MNIRCKLPQSQILSPDTMNPITVEKSKKGASDNCNHSSAFSHTLSSLAKKQKAMQLTQQLPR